MRVTGLALLAAALGLALPGCGGDDPPSSSPTPSSGAIEVKDFEFSPTEETFKAGEKVDWKNTGEQIHNVKGDGFFSRAMEAGDTYSFTFKKPGSYPYVCTLHPQMKGTVVVE